jgi:hypothetical protein
MFIEFDEAGGDVIDRLIELNRVRARLDAAEAVLLVEAASTATVVEEFTILDDETDQQREIRIEDAIREEIACALRWSTAATQGRIETARWLCGPLRATLEALRAGEISLAHARIIVDAAETVPSHQLAEFERRVLGTARRGGLSLTRRAANRVNRALDPDGYVLRRQRATCTRDVWVYDDADGLSVLMARMSREQATIVMTTVDAAARAAKKDAVDSAVTIGEHRAAALLALVTGTQAAPHVTAQVDVVLDPLMLLDLQGLGGTVIDALADLAGARDLHLVLRRLVRDPATGHLLDYGRTTYDVPQRLRDYIVARDRTCRFPGCNTKAERCELDHATSWHDGGTTSADNLGALCKRHHRLKTHAGWDITGSRPNGSCRWRSPRGREYESDPDPLPS